MKSTQRTGKLDIGAILVIALLGFAIAIALGRAFFNPFRYPPTSQPATRP